MEKRYSLLKDCNWNFEEIVTGSDLKVRFNFDDEDISLLDRLGHLEVLGYGCVVTNPSGLKTQREMIAENNRKVRKSNKKINALLSERR